MRRHAYRTVFLGFFASLVFGGAAFAGDAGKKGEECAIGKKVGALLGEWKVVAAEAKTAKPAQQKQFATKVGALKKDCPVGCRLGETIGTVRDVLGTVIAMGESCEKDGPIAKAENAGANNEACAAGTELKATRTKALGGLHQLASYVASITADGECCSATKTKSAKGVAAASAKCAEGSCSSAAASSVSDPSRLPPWQPEGLVG